MFVFKQLKDDCYMAQDDNSTLTWKLVARAQPFSQVTGGLKES